MSLFALVIGILIEDRQGLGLWIAEKDIDEYEIALVRKIRSAEYLLIIASGIMFFVIPYAYGTYIFPAIVAATIIICEVIVKKSKRH